MIQKWCALLCHFQLHLKSIWKLQKLELIHLLLFHLLLYLLFLLYAVLQEISILFLSLVSFFDPQSCCTVWIFFKKISTAFCSFAPSSLALALYASFQDISFAFCSLATLSLILLCTSLLRTHSGSAETLQLDEQEGTARVLLLYKCCYPRHYHYYWSPCTATFINQSLPSVSHYHKSNN